MIRKILAVVFLLACCCQQPQEAVHDPPIDCPLEKAGVHADDLKPFDEVEEYIAFLEREDRALWQKPDAVVETLRLQGDEIVADVGAGSGYFTFRLAEAVPRGKVLALDIEPEMVRHIHHRAMMEGASNIEAILVEPDDPQLPDGVDVVFICDVLHHVPDRSAWLSKVASKMSDGAHLVLIEFKEGDLPAGPPAAMKIPRMQMIHLLDEAGFTLAEEGTELLPYQYFLVFEKG